MKQLAHAVRILGILGDDAAARELPRLPGPNADDLAGIARVEIMKGIEAGHAGDAGDEQR